MPCRNFAAGVQAVAEANPDVPVCLFLGSMPADTAVRARRAMKVQKRYVGLGPAPFVPLVAVLWPRARAQDFLFWAHQQRRLSRADDGNASRWMRATKQQILATVPSLVEHNDGESSVKGGRDHIPWQETWRRALFLAEDASQYDW